jgi:phosphate starvation-inducible PhoH-like protein
MSKKRTVITDNDQQEYTIKLENRLQAKTEGHKNYIRTMVENDITICVGPPGSGKSFTSVGLACEYLARDQVDKIIFSRPIIQCGKDIGSLPGDITEKTQAYFYPILDCLDHFIGKNKYKGLVANKKIEFIPLELMRGMSIKDTFLVLDESSNAQFSQLKMLMSRLDNGSKFVLNGDYKQCDLYQCDFKIVADKLKRSRIDGLGFCELTNADVQRPKFINDIMACLED